MGKHSRKQVRKMRTVQSEKQQEPWKGRAQRRHELQHPFLTCRKRERLENPCRFPGSLRSAGGGLTCTRLEGTSPIPRMLNCPSISPTNQAPAVSLRGEQLRIKGKMQKRNKRGYLCHENIR